MSNDLVIKDLCANIGDNEILKGVNLTIRGGTIHAIMGPNGSGKSTLAHVIAGHPDYEVTAGEIWYGGQNILELEADERSKLGLFLAFQYPVAVPGVTVANFLRAAINAHRAEEGKDPKATAIPMAEFRKMLREGMKTLEMDEGFARRYLNEGFSGGEKKRLEILQMTMLKPGMVVMDETDSGLDIDALRIVAEGVNRLAGPELGALVITHYQRLLNYIKPNFVSVMMDGRIVRDGGPELALELEEKGYDWLREELAGAA
ncbi:Fe-S cluster assembly ATPase SufC [Candidatus Chloroploca sp. M-50]|uniref:Fe-S cluster assembly ATPase SufC n=2 Tax=Candidatus Chloroploca TaxID=1579476 RepID=A0A2H3KIE2_9CHLR|nr:MULTISPECIES: Fe-S cluster assembly ATPase SufC [Candidatus Chloroploca]MBP1466091.1 Fe-S cluster assembly ATPase SufC [Candidatus Chloroploca mongolica]PDV97598.1 Fe-S cluster assembly ATPase SufC [Candidatus Chloroploca asiatica]